MRITHRMVADTINNNLQHNLKRLEFYGHQLSTGKKFTKPSQDPVGVGRVMNYSSSLDRNEQYRLNMNQTRGWLETTESSLQDGLNVLQRIRELCIYGANESLTAEDRRAIAPEVLEFIDHLIGVGNRESSGLYIFGGHQTLDRPFIRDNIYHVQTHQDSGISLDEDHQVEAHGLQNGMYRIDQASLEKEEAVKALLGQQYLQGNAASIFGKAEVGENLHSEDLNASIEVEISGIDYGTGEVQYRYSAHQYSMEGEYSREEGTFSLIFGGDDSQEIVIGENDAISLNLEGFLSLDNLDNEGLMVGDKAIINVTPALAEGQIYNQLKMTGQYRNDQSETTYYFNEDVLNNRDVELHFHSLNMFERSNEHGKLYDGYLSYSYAGYRGLESEEAALQFSFDNQGFPVYQGDNNERIQEISPHQQIIMNLSGTKAFGENQEMFEAVYDVYNALMENDREKLGNDALKKMDQSIDHLFEQLAQVGARSNRLEAMDSTLFSENLFLQEVRSKIEDIDLAYVITEFTMQENAYRAALATAQKMLQPTLVDYLR